MNCLIRLPRFTIIGLLFTYFLIPISWSASEKRPQTISEDQDWAAVYIWDAFVPIVLDKSIPEMLISLEVIFQQHVNYLAKYQLKVIDRKFGTRSTEGHFMMWLHFGKRSRSQLKDTLSDLRKRFGDDFFVHKNSDSDFFIAWGGEANFRDFILDGVIGLTRPTVLPNGKLTGDFQGLSVALGQGNPDYAGGWFITQEQAKKMVEAIPHYTGQTKGYSFLSRLEDMEDSSYETPNAKAGNGRNCGDFAMYMLTTSGVVPKSTAESWKTTFWYPEKYWDHTIPLSGSGKKVFAKFSADRSVYMSRDKLLGLGLKEFLFTGLEVFDEKALVEEIRRERPEVHPVRLWDQAKVIEHLGAGGAQFQALSVQEGLYQARVNQSPINSPFAFNKQQLHFRSSKLNRGYQKGGEKRTWKKIKKIGLTNLKELNDYRELEHALRRP